MPPSIVILEFSVLMQESDLARDLVVSGVLDSAFYGAQIEGEMSEGGASEQAAHYIASGCVRGLLPSGEFDPSYYSTLYSDVGEGLQALAHFLAHGRSEGRIGSLASHLTVLGLTDSAVSDGLIPAIGTREDYSNPMSALAASLRVIDNDPRYFSAKYYCERYPDVAEHTIHPLLHFLKSGKFESRTTNIDLLRAIEVQDHLFRKNLPNLLLVVNDGSKTGAPIVGVDLARELTDQYNIIFVSLRDGPLIEICKEFFPVVVTASYIAENNRFLSDIIQSRFPFSLAIASSSACVNFINPLSAHDVKIVCLVHEFYEYMQNATGILKVCDLLVFSSSVLLESWKEALEDFGRDPQTVMVLPQPAAASSARVRSKAAARAAIAEATGLDLEGKKIVLAAGQVQIRKGTDIFVQLGSQLKRANDRFVAIWIGEPISRFDMSYGIWLHAQIERSKDENGTPAVHFEPAGPLYPILMDAADVFVVPSRLDPLPNVALEAAARDVPVIAFRDATGLRDVAREGKINLTEVEIGAVDQMINAIQNLTA